MKELDEEPIQGGGEMRGEVKGEVRELLPIGKCVRVNPDLYLI